MAGLCSVALPDMEMSAIYSSLTRSGSKTIVLLLDRTAEQLQSPHQHRTNRTVTHQPEVKTASTGSTVSGASGSNGENGGSDNPFLEVFSASDSSDNERCLNISFEYLLVYPFSLSLVYIYTSKAMLISLKTFSCQCWRRG